MIITGKVKIIKKQEDYYQIKDEVIVVAERTTPDIVVIINKVKAIVTEVDNKLCHAAIIAREYDIPLVMGQVMATKKYQDGDIISINAKTKTIC